MLLYIVELLLEFARHFVPHVDEAEFNDFKFFATSGKERLSLAVVLGLNGLHFPLVTFYQLFRSFEQLFARVHVELLSLDLLRLFNLLL